MNSTENHSLTPQEQRQLISGISSTARSALEVLIDTSTNALRYQAAMITLGEELGKRIPDSISTTARLNALVSTAEDADFLTLGIARSLEERQIDFKTIVFWNNHYTPANSSKSVAPIVNSFFEEGYEAAKNIIIAKSIISGSCVVRTNIMSLIDKIDPERIFILAPVIHTSSEEKLKKEFPEKISSKFEFLYFACDSQRLENGDVIPGIGGQVYERLGLDDQPVKTGYLPNVVKNLLSLQ